MKILHLFDFFSPHGGGTVDLVGKLAVAMAARGHDVSIYTSDYQLDRAYLDNLTGVRVHPLHCVLNLAKFYITPGLGGLVRENLREFDIVHLHCFRSYQNIIIRRYAVKFGVPYVLDTHGSLPLRTEGETGIKWRLRRLFDVLFGRRILRDADRAIAETELGRREYREFGVPEERIALIPPPFDTEAFSELPPRGDFRKKYGLEGKEVVMFLGRIDWIKGLDFLAEAFAGLAAVNERAVLVIVGNDYGYLADLHALVDRLGITDRVVFPGFLGGRDKLAALVDADVFVQTSRYEQGAWAPFEAILCGTPIIVSGNSGAGEDVARIDAGDLVEFGNRDELAARLQRVLRDPGPAREKAARAAAYIRENMSIDRRIEDYERLYVECRREPKV